ncbi:MAG: flagellar biosynthetic protein FliR, partial [Ruminiclostridium sp.]
MAIFNTVLSNFTAYLMILCRVTGIFTFNPIFSRSNVPNSVKAAMSVALAAVMVGSLGENVVTPEFSGAIGFVLIVVKELFVGLVFGFFTHLIMT